LSDKLELEARQYEVIRKEKEVLARENENLRLRIGQLNEKPDQKLGRDLEVFARAEKRMMIQAPGFAGAWETAKAAAADEMTAEDQGRSLPRRIFSRLFGAGSPPRELLPAEAASTSQSNGSDPAHAAAQAATATPAPDSAAAGTTAEKS
jgi:hypothetical protein